MPHSLNNVCIELDLDLGHWGLWSVIDSTLRMTRAHLTISVARFPKLLEGERKCHILMVERKQWDYCVDNSFVFWPFLCSGLTAFSPHFRWQQLEASCFFPKEKRKKGQIRAESSNGKFNNWKPPVLYFIFIDSLFIQTAGSEFVPHSNRVLIIYRQQRICLKPHHCFAVNLSKTWCKWTSFWLTALHKLITTHTLHYNAIRLSIIL